MIDCDSCVPSILWLVEIYKHRLWFRFEFIDSVFSDQSIVLVYLNFFVAEWSIAETELYSICIQIKFGHFNSAILIILNFIFFSLFNFVEVRWLYVIFRHLYKISLLLKAAVCAEIVFASLVDTSEFALVASEFVFTCQISPDMITTDQSVLNRLKALVNKLHRISHVDHLVPFGTSCKRPRFSFLSQYFIRHLNLLLLLLILIVVTIHKRLQSILSVGILPLA